MEFSDFDEKRLAGLIQEGRVPTIFKRITQEPDEGILFWVPPESAQADDIIGGGVDEGYTYLSSDGTQARGYAEYFIVPKDIGEIIRQRSIEALGGLQ